MDCKPLNALNSILLIVYSLCTGWYETFIKFFPSYLVWVSRCMTLQDNKLSLSTKKSHHNVVHFQIYKRLKLGSEKCLGDWPCEFERLLTPKYSQQFQTDFVFSFYTRSYETFIKLLPSYFVWVSRRTTLQDKTSHHYISKNSYHNLYSRCKNVRISDVREAQIGVQRAFKGSAGRLIECC